MAIIPSPVPGREQSCLRLWAVAACGSAVVLTAIDAVLLQQKKAFFTGGFLTTAYTRSAAEAAAFLGTSFLMDAAAAGMVAIAALWITSRLRLTPLARLTVALSAGLIPLLGADVIAYQLLSYVGEAFDLSLMFDLTGRRPSELFAVAAGHLRSPALVTGAILGAVIIGVWALNKRNAAARRHLGRSRRAMAVAVTLAFVATIVTVALGGMSETVSDGLQRKPSGRLFGAVAERLTDVDRDGYGIGSKLSDPDPFNAAVYPYALDVPGNGIDEDGVGGDLPSGAAAYSEATASPHWLARPHVVLFVLESFRADAVGRMLNGKAVTPTLDALARTGVSASMVYSQNGYTAQSRFHIFSGSLADLRGHRTLIDDFKANGYDVGYFSGQDDSFGGPAYAVGFDRADVAYDARQDRGKRYSTYATAGSLAVPFGRVQEKIAAFLDHRDQSRPLFLYVNFEDTHYPYHHDGVLPLVADTWVRESQIDRAHTQAVQAMYYNMAANVDRAVGATLDMASRALGSTPAVVVTGDHGESLFDESFLGHGYALNDVQTRIPLVVNGLPMTIAEPSGQSDLRDAIGAALARDPSQQAAPRVTRPEGRAIFQYLGTIDRPRQIAFVSAEGRIIYDFRTRQVALADGAWQRPERLEGDGRASFERLVQFWERMMLARAKAAGGTAPTP
jgi:hypothetical protein